MAAGTGFSKETGESHGKPSGQHHNPLLQRRAAPGPVLFFRFAADLRAAGIDFRQ